jgi:nitrite reductase (NADH) large subunit
MRIGIIGGGPAGIEAALAVRHANAEATLFTAEPVLPYFRPRLVGVAMGQVAPDAIAMHPAEWYSERGICLRMGEPVAALDIAARRVQTAAGASTSFDAIVIATGSKPVRPRFAGETSVSPVFTLWSLADANAIRNRAHPGSRLVVIGGGILGLECALRARERQMEVTVVEKLPRLLPMRFGEAASALLQSVLKGKGISFRIGQAVTGIHTTPASDGSIRVHLSEGAPIDADLALVCIGAGPDLSLARQAGLATGRGILTDAFLQAAPGIWVAGDVSEAAGRPAIGMVRESAAQGRTAGANVLSGLSGGAQQPFVPEIAPISLHCAGVDLCAAGQVGGVGVFEQRLDNGERAGVLRMVTRNASRLVGVQMIGSREGFEELVRGISLQATIVPR